MSEMKNQNCFIQSRAFWADAVCPNKRKIHFSQTTKDH